MIRWLSLPGEGAFDIAGDVVTLTSAGATGTFASKDVANNITVTINGLALGGESNPTHVQIGARGTTTSLKLTNKDGQQQLITP